MSSPSEPSLAVVLGASEWPQSPNLSPQPSYAASAADLLAYLASPDGVGIPSENICNLFDDPRSAGEIDAEVGEFLEARVRGGNRSIGNVFVIYIGHAGFVGASSDLFLAVRAVRKDREGSSGLRVEDIARTIRTHTVGLRRFVILDCCFAAAAVAKFQSPLVDVVTAKALEGLPNEGTAMLCASSATDPAIAPIGLARTMFSDALLEVLSTGNAAYPERLSLEDVRDLADLVIRDRFAEGVRPEVHTPQQQNGNVAKVRIFPNAAHRVEYWESRAVDSELANEEMRRRVELLEKTSARSASASAAGNRDDTATPLRSVANAQFSGGLSSYWRQFEIRRSVSPSDPIAAQRRYDIALGFGWAWVLIGWAGPVLVAVSLVSGFWPVGAWGGFLSLSVGALAVGRIMDLVGNGYEILRADFGLGILHEYRIVRFGLIDIPHEYFWMGLAPNALTLALLVSWVVFGWPSWLIK